MALIFNCDRCHEELNEPGAVLLSPPVITPTVIKYHLCVICWKIIREYIWNINKFPEDNTGRP